MQINSTKQFLTRTKQVNDDITGLTRNISFPEFSVDRCAPKTASEDAQIAAFARTCYEFGVNRGGSFAEARAYCQSHNGDLAHGMSPGSTSFLYAELERRKPMLKTQLVWIGAQKEPGLTSRTWKWVNGELLVND